MLQTLALAAALSLAPAQNGALTLNNERITQGGILGSKRASADFIPGDVVYFSWNIENMQLTPKGTVEYTIGLEVTDAMGRPVFSAPPASRIEVTLPQGGTKLQASAYFGIEPSQKEGPLTCRISVRDVTAGVTKTSTQKINVLPARFGLVGVTAYLHPERQVASPLQLVEGQTLWLGFGVVGFARGAGNGQPNIAVELQILQGGKPLAQPIVVTLNPNKVVPAGQELIDFGTQPLPMNRTGDFTIEVTARDKAGNKTDKVTLPLTVTAVK
ncbi:MAG: hypothetical protein ACJ8F7_01290 [Gemmataceae bacterium]